MISTVLHSVKCIPASFIHIFPTCLGFAMLVHYPVCDNKFINSTNL